MIQLRKHGLATQSPKRMDALSTENIAETKLLMTVWNRKELHVPAKVRAKVKNPRSLKARERENA
jgi:hypothetical protein